MAKIAIVIPAYNEEKTIEQTIQSCFHQLRQPDFVIVVNNNSTDTTVSILNSLKKTHSNLYIVNETKKGTGYACRTGFDYAIGLGADLIARTDADTILPKRWLKTIEKYFAKNPRKLLLGGITYANRHDEHFRWHDFITPFSTYIWRLVIAVKLKRLYALKTVYGHNLSLRAEAYAKTDGFKPGSISSSDEDLELTREFYEKFGFRSIGFSHLVGVKTSQRRVRSVGKRNMGKYFLTYSEEERKKMAGGDVDIR
jgi:glycosyltransferase involved in cell wall biosynthesis